MVRSCALARLACLALLFACVAAALLAPSKASAASVSYYFSASTSATAWPWGESLQTQPLPGGTYAVPQTPSATDYGRTFLSTTDPAASTATTWRYEFATAGDRLLGVGLRSAAYATPVVVAAGATGRFSIRNEGGTFRFELVDFTASGATAVLGSASIATTNESNRAYSVTFDNAAATVVAGHRIGVRVYVNTPTGTRHRLAYGAGANNLSYFTVDETPAPGTISGTVTNSSNGAPVVGATVTAGAYTTATGAGGIYTLSGVAAGAYAMTAAKTGFTTGAQAGVVVTAGSTTTTDFALVDVAAPTTSPSSSPAAPGSSGWFTVAPEIILTATDAEGSSVTIRYDWEITPPTTVYSTKFTAPSGTKTLYYRSTDGAGNIEAVQSLVFKVDTSIVAPAVTTPVGAELTPTTVHGTIDFDSTAGDALSGVDHVGFFWYDRMGVSWNPVGYQVGVDQTTPVSDSTYRVSWNTASVADGLYKLESQLADVAGNTAFSPAQYVLVDNSGPTVALKNPATNARISGAYAITGTATDANLANWTLQMRAVGDPTWNTLASGTAAVTNGTFFTLDTTSYAAGQYEFQILAADTAGNSSTPDLHTPVTIDNVRPTVVSATAVNRTTANVVFSEDLTPGSINKTYFTITGLTVSAAALQADKKTVALTMSNQTDGVTYTVTAKNTAATVTDLAGNIVGTPNAATYVGTAVDVAPPGVPTGLAATSGRDQNDLVWIGNLEPDLAGYNVYRDTTSGGTFDTKVNDAPLTSPFFTDTSFMPTRGVYWYKITAVDTLNNESSKSAAESAELVRLSALVPETGATLRSSTGDVSITIPAGALATPTTIQIAEKAQPANRGAASFVSAAYEFSPSGQTFSAPVSITMSYAPGSVDETTIRLVYANVGTWTRVEGGSAPDPTTQSVTGQVDHFTEFAAAAIDVTPPTVSIGPPANGAAGIPVDGFVTIVFSEAMDAGTLISDSLQIRTGPPPSPPAAAPTGTKVPLSVVFAKDLQTVYLYPDRMLDIGATYYAWIDGAAVKDAAGNPLEANATSTFTTATTGVSPHDGYAASTNLCSNCHAVHGSSGPTLFVEATEKQVCYTCHDGTGSSYNVKTADTTMPFAWDFGEDPVGTTSKISYHPVPGASTAAPVTGVTMLCSNCHNAHSMTGSGERFLAPKKLDPKYSGVYGPQAGNQFCWTCHDASATLSAGYISADSWNKSTGFDHTTYFPGTGHDSSLMAENPTVPSKESIACKGCHSEHGSTNDKLIAEKVNGQAVTFLSGSAVDYNTNYNSVCVACHAEADVARSYWPGSATYSHSGHGTPTSAVKTLPYAPNDAAGDLPLQVNLCKQCHEPHGAGDADNKLAYPNLTRLFEENVCYRCHGTASNPTGAKNIQTQFAAASSHDLGMSTNKARMHDQDAEEAKPVSGAGNPLLSGEKRHVECADCHNAHVSTPSVPHVQGTNLVSGVLAGVWGVDAASPGAAWSNPSSWTWAKKSPATAEYQICFKCHSAASYGSALPVATQDATRGPTFWNSPTYTDQSREFNPNNASYHAVWGASKAGGSGTYLNGWTATSQMYCSDCHKSSTAGTPPKGTHGSATPWILGGYGGPESARYVTGGNGGAEYDNKAARDADFTFCFGCHSNSFTGTGFAKEGDNLHTLGEHVTRACTNCHAAVPHGSNRKHLLYFSIPTTLGGPADPAPYNDHPGDTSYGLPSDMNIDQTSGNWQEEDCNGSGDACHGSQPAPLPAEPQPAPQP